jgi:hypothetical protein
MGWGVRHGWCHVGSISVGACCSTFTWKHGVLICIGTKQQTRGEEAGWSAHTRHAICCQPSGACGCAGMLVVGRGLGGCMHGEEFGVGVRRIRSEGAAMAVKQQVDWLMAGKLLGPVSALACL